MADEKRDDEFKHNVEEYIRVSKDYRRQLTALSLTIIAAIYVFAEKSIGDISMLRYALLLLFMTILTEVLANFLKSHHYAAWIDGKADTIDFRSSWYGRISEGLFGISLLFFIPGCICFIVAILK